MRRIYALLLLAVVLSLTAFPMAGSAAPGDLDYDITNGHFYTQANGQPLGTATSGFAITNDDGITFWDSYKNLGGPTILGYPISKRFKYDGFVTQVMQKSVLQWDPQYKEVVFLNTFDALHDKGKDDWLLNLRQTPKPFDTSPDTGLTLLQVTDRHLAFLDQNAEISKVYNSDSDPINHFGLPVSYAEFSNSFVIRAQRATFQYWKEATAWADKGEVTIANGGDLAKEAGIWPADALIPDAAGLASVSDSSAGSAPAPAPAAVATPTSIIPANASIPAAGTNMYKAKSPEYGMNIFIAGNPNTTQRDLKKVTDAGFSWQKTLFQWRNIEGAGKGQYNWTEYDRIVKASNDAGVKIIARIDFQPMWARADKANNGPPDNYQDFKEFMYKLVDRYKAGSQYGRIYGVEIWNEPNLAREWGDKKPDAAQYVKLLQAGYEGTKAADPSMTVITAGLTPTESWDANATPDTLFLQQMYEAGAKNYFDVLGAHGAGYKAPPSMSPDQVAADKSYGGNRFFCFRRIEDLRNVMVKNGDGSKQIWLLEFGWTSDEIHAAYSWHKVTEDQKAEYLVEAYKWAATNWSPWIGVMVAWNLPDPTWNTDREEYWWSIANLDGSDRPAYTKLKAARQSGYLP